MKEKYSQPELFTQVDGGNLKRKEFSNSFLCYIRAYERIILVIFALIITGLVSFSQGVEKGKRLVALKTHSPTDIPVKVQNQSKISISSSKPTANKSPKIQTALPPTAINQIPKVQQYPNKIKREPEKYVQNYTVQVASYRNKNNAQKEAVILKRKGLSSLVLSKGRFNIVCVGSFSKREKAESLLPKLKKQYQDCRIRRL